MDLFSNSESAELIKFPVSGGELFLMHDFLSPDEAHDYFDNLNESVKWRQETLKIYGKEHVLQRETAWYGDEERNYQYSGVTHNPTLWTKELSELKQRIEQITGEKFNSVLLNKYRSGNDKVGWHSDNEKAFGKKTTIASLSLGTSRYFDIRQKKDKSNKMRIELHAGSLLVMKGEFQQYWEHQVPVQKLVTGVRINLTFRQLI